MRRSPLRKLFSAELAVLYAVLVTGAVLFSFPFIWMVATSFKTNREMSSVDAGLWPSAPRPQASSPYIDLNAFKEPRRFSGTEEAVWQEARPRLDGLFARRVAARRPCDAVTEGDAQDTDTLNSEMVQGLFTLIGETLSDTSRAAGADAIVQEADRLVDAVMLDRVYDRAYQQISLGEVRVRGRDYSTHVLSHGDGWAMVRGGGGVIEQRGPGEVSTRLDVRFTGSEPACVVGLEPEVGIDPAEIDRVFVSCRGDGSWARVAFEVIRSGRTYRTSEVINFSDSRWREVQLRWRDGVADPMQRRAYYWLDPAGPAPADSPPFAVRVTVTRNSQTGAWIDKVLHQYRAVFRELPFGRYITTSLSLSILSIILMVFSCTLSAYAFARLNWPGRDLCFVIMLATMMIPPQVTMIPSFLIFKSVGWYDTLLPLWVPALFGTPFFIFLLRQFLMTIPRDLEDAARIDGCGFLRIYWHVMVPLVTPTIAIIAVYTFIATWNNFMGPLIYVNDERLFPIALGLFKFNLRAGGDVGLMMAAAFIMTLPIIALFFFVQRYFIQGVTLTGMKG